MRLSLGMRTGSTRNLYSARVLYTSRAGVTVYARPLLFTSITPNARLSPAAESALTARMLGEELLCRLVADGERFVWR